MSSKKAQLLENALQQDLHPFAARFTQPSPPPENELEGLQTTVTPQAVNPASGEAGSSESGVAGIRVSGGVRKSPSGEAVNTANGAGSKVPAGQGATINQLSKWTMYVRPKTKKAVQRLALEDDVNYYDIVQEALDDYLIKRGIKQ